MKLLQLLAIGDLEAGLVDELGTRLSAQFHVPWDVLPGALDPQFAFHAERQQYHSTEILAQVRSLASPECWRLLGVTAHDLYIPILTFVFGEAQMGGSAALVSTHRLRQEFYGLPGDRTIFGDRLLKEAVHELGHTLELRHCEDYRCAMASSHAVEWIDLKEPALCSSCSSRIASHLPRETKAKFRFF